MYEEFQKIEIKIKTFLIFLFSIFLLFILFLFLSVDSVYAKSYTWDSPFLLTASNKIDNSWGPGTYSIYGRNTNTISYSGGRNGIDVRYSVSSNTSNTDSTLEQGSYAFTFSFMQRYHSSAYQVPMLQNLTLWYFTTSSKDNYSKMTCDVGESFTYQQKKVANYIDIYVTYKCSRLDVNRSDITHVAFQFTNFFSDGTAIDSYYTEVYSNMYLLSIDDDSQSIEDIIANANQNANTIINSQNSNTDKLVDSIQGSDLTDNEKESVDKDTLNDYNDSESALLDENRLNAINNIDISIDSNTNDFIWNFITSVINTHTRIFGFVIAILSIGIIKLVLNR